jgi:hypothetical protein
MILIQIDNPIIIEHRIVSPFYSDLTCEDLIYIWLKLIHEVLIYQK